MGVAGTQAGMLASVATEAVVKVVVARAAGVLVVVALGVAAVEAAAAPGKSLEREVV